jgi:hypothetical protein
MFSIKKTENYVKTKYIRLLGWFMSCGGFWLIFSPFYAFLGWFPLIGTLLQAIGSYTCGIIGVILGSLTSLITISISWIFYR